MAPYDIIGNIAIVKFDRETSMTTKKRWSTAFLKGHSSVKTVIEKSGKISGRLRTPTTKFIAGVKTKEALHRENGCEFRLNIDTCYFSPRLSSERSELASFVKKGERVLVMFGGVGVFAVVIGKSKKPSEVVSVELGRIPSKYGVENVKRNKVGDIVRCVQGDVRRVVPKLSGNFDRIVMARPNLSDSFLDVAFKKTKKGGMIYYYGFYLEDDLDIMKNMILDEAKKAKKKIKILKIKKAGDIGTRKYRYRVDIRILN
jgi:tRNA (guanine37-N1)-methyltransferase